MMMPTLLRLRPMVYREFINGGT